MHKQEHALKAYGCVKVELHAVTMVLNRCSHMGTRQIKVFTFMSWLLKLLYHWMGVWWVPEPVWILWIRQSLFPAVNLTMILQPYRWFISCYQTAWCSSNTLDLHLGDAWFKCWLGHWLAWLWHILSFFNRSRKTSGNHSTSSVSQ